MSAQNFEIARLEMISAFHAGHLKDNARAFAWSARVYPANPYALEEVFEDDFKVSARDLSAVWKVIDDGELNNKRVKFYDLESKFGVRSGQMDRTTLIDICRLAHIDHRFDQLTWDALTKPGSGPVEFQGIADSFDPSADIDF